MVHYGTLVPQHRHEVFFGLSVSHTGSSTPDARGDRTGFDRTTLRASGVDDPVSDLYAPVGGVITEVNAGLADDLAKLSDDPFGEGWIVKVQVSDAAALEGLMDHPAYVKFCEAE